MTDKSNEIKYADLFKKAAFQSLESSGQFTPEEREAIASAIAAGIYSYRQRLLDNLDRLKRKSLLESIARMQQQLPTGRTVDDVRLAEGILSDLSEIQDNLAHIEEDEYVVLTKIGNGFAVVLTDRGHKVVKGEESYELRSGS